MSADLNLTITINNKGKGLLRASGTGDFGAITSSPIVFAVIPFNEPDSDNNPGIKDGDYNCNRPANCSLTTRFVHASA